MAQAVSQSTSSSWCELAYACWRPDLFFQASHQTDIGRGYLRTWQDAAYKIRVPAPAHALRGAKEFGGPYWSSWVGLAIRWNQSLTIAPHEITVGVTMHPHLNRNYFQMCKYVTMQYTEPGELWDFWKRFSMLFTEFLKLCKAKKPANKSHSRRFRQNVLFKPLRETIFNLKSYHTGGPRILK